MDRLAGFGESDVPEPVERLLAGFANRAASDVSDDRPRRYEESEKRLGAFLDVTLSELTKQLPDLASVVSAWPTLPESLRTAILSIIQVAVKRAR